MTDPTSEGDRGPGRVERTRVRALAARRDAAERVTALRSTSSLIDSLVRAWEYDSEIGGGLMAGALAFRLFLYMVPFTACSFALLSLLSTLTGSNPHHLSDAVGIGGVLAKGVGNTGSISSTSRWVLLVVSGYATVLGARTVVRTLVDAYCLVWRIPRLRVKRTRAAMVLIGFTAVYALLASLLGRLRAVAPAPGVALTIAALAVPLLAWWWASAHLPHADAPAWALLPGAVVFAVGVEAIHIFTIVYISRSVASKSETYGVIGVSLGVLLWAYVVGRLLTGTAVVNATLWRRFVEHHPEAVEAVRRQHADARSRAALGSAWLRSAAGLFR